KLGTTICLQVYQPDSKSLHCKSFVIKFYEKNDNHKFAREVFASLTTTKAGKLIKPKSLDMIVRKPRYPVPCFCTMCHKANWTHQVVGAAAAFGAMKLYESKHPEDKHALSKELLAALAGAEADKLFETKGLDFIDREKAKKNAERLYNEKYAN
ncbi:hypothetical protein BGZ49_002704, partial [Haplosporangium sp. Z 27]